MFVHNYRTAAVWVKGHVGKKEMGGGGKNKTAGRNPDERDRGTETIAISLLVHLVAILSILSNNCTTIMYGTSWETLL